MSLPSASLRVLAAAQDRGLHIEIRLFPDGTKTSADAAAAVGCPLSAIAKSLVFTADDQPVVAIMPGDRRVDPDKLAAAVGANRARRASLDEARSATGYAPGGTPAFGFPQPIPVVIDERLRAHDEVWSAAGTPTSVYPIALEDLVRASGARFVDIAAD